MLCFFNCKRNNITNRLIAKVGCMLCLAAAGAAEGLLSTMNNDVNSDVDQLIAKLVDSNRAVAGIHWELWVATQPAGASPAWQVFRVQTCAPANWSASLPPWPSGC